MKRSLVDPYGRVIDYMRVSITDLCNLRCVYCIPPEGVKQIPHDEILRYEEILRIIVVAKDLGVSKIRVTGGEPLVRRGALEFVSRLTAMPNIDDVGLTTNGVLLSALAADLRAAGLTRINVSLDSLRRDMYERITGSDQLSRVLAGIDAALDAGLQPVKINVVLLEGINEEDVPAFARLSLDRPLDVRFIERMPFGVDWLPNSPDPFSAAKVFRIIRDEIGELEPIPRETRDGPATMYRLPDAQGRIGIIDAVTGHFCGTCNRLRLTARGNLRPCLLGHMEIDIKSALREEASEEELARIIQSAVNRKPLGNCAAAGGVQGRMNRIGG